MDYAAGKDARRAQEGITAMGEANHFTTDSIFLVLKG